MNNTDHYNDLLRQVPNTHKTLRIKIMHNIGILFVKMGQYNDACSSFEWIMSEQVRRIHTGIERGSLNTIVTRNFLAQF